MQSWGRGHGPGHLTGLTIERRYPAVTLRVHYGPSSPQFDGLAFEKYTHDVIAWLENGLISTSTGDSTRQPPGGLEVTRAVTGAVIAQWAIPLFILSKRFPETDRIAFRVKKY